MILWRFILTCTGGLRVDGCLPLEPCVLVANHSSHADTAALLAALPARRRPVVAAAADYWFARRLPRLIRRFLVPAFPVRRTGGGSADLAAGAALLAAGHDVIVYPEGTRSRDGSVAEFRSGAARLAGLAGAPLVPVGIAGTRDLMPVHGRPGRGRITVRIGAPVEDLVAARSAVVELAKPPGRHRRLPSSPLRTGAGLRARRDSSLRRRVAAFAGSGLGLLTVGLWAAGEAVMLPLLPEFALVILVVSAHRTALRLALAAAIGSLAGGALMYVLAAHGLTPPAPLTTPLMHTTAGAEVAAHGASALRDQPLSGIPYKVYGLAAGRAHVGLGQFLAESVPARAVRILVVAGLAALFGAAARTWRHWYPVFVAVFVILFAAGLTAVVISWS